MIFNRQLSIEKKSFISKNQTLRSYQSIYFAYRQCIFRSYWNMIILTITYLQL